jgi:uncharacterized FAD-dependent dehydrogenase
MTTKRRVLPDTVTLELDLDEPDDGHAIRAGVARLLRTDPAELPELTLRRRSLDSRHGRIRFHLLIELMKEGPARTLADPQPREVKGPSRVVIVGDGPAGLFCAYELARQGIASTVVDRGKPVQPRRRDLKGLNRHGIVDPDSNYCFGEGGAGTYSDGKLYTRSQKRGDVRDVLEILQLHGAPEAILSDARPHIGSNRLPKVVSSLRERLESVGVGFQFGKRVTRILCGNGGERRITGVGFADGSELGADAVVLATGHSARDILRLLLELGEALEAKPFALGVRIEHPQGLINRIQYGKHAGHPRLPSAAYSLANTEADSRVFSFCMSPGGFVVPASTEPGALVVNGMSLSKRNSPFANSGLVVGIDPEQVEAAGYPGPLGGIELQASIERAAFAAGDPMLRAPATRARDFMEGRGSSTVPKSSYIPGLIASDVAQVLDAGGLRLAGQLRAALGVFEKKMRGYLSEDAVLIGVESRTSSPVRIVRDPQSLMSTRFHGLYPCAEGAGYAGGIVSAAMDGQKVAQAIARSLAPE